MRVPIKWALYQGLTPYKTVVTKDLSSIKNTEFGVFDVKRYPAVKFARTVIRNKGTYGAVLNAANEVAVNAFLNHKIRFTMIEKIISLMMKMHQSISHPTYEDIAKVDKLTRETVDYFIKEGGIK
jgi:1-deoxy-D-xylulose-5-phosphate reductoisomerase